MKNVYVKINNKENLFFKNFSKDTVEFHIAHNEGNFFCSKEQLKDIEDNNQIALLYSDADGNIDEKYNPNGSIKNIAGIVNKKGNVFGLMPHPERASDELLGGMDGSLIFKSLK